MTTSPAPTRAYPARRRYPGTCSACSAPIEIAENRLSLKNYCPTCRRAAMLEYGRAQYRKPGYSAARYERQAERRRIAREIEERQKFEPAPGMPGYVMVPCSDCHEPVPTIAFRATQRRVCDACRAAAKALREKERYRIKTAEARAKRPVVNMPNRSHHNYARPLTLLSVPDDSWPVGGTLAFEAWLPLVEAGDLAGAQWRDPGGAQYTAAAGQIVRVTG